MLQVHIQTQMEVDIHFNDWSVNVKRKLYFLIAVLILDTILVGVIHIYFQESFTLFSYINGIIILFVFIVGIRNIIIAVKKKRERDIGIIGSFLLVLLFCINICIFCFVPSPTRYKAALISLMVICVIQLLFFFIKTLIERNTKNNSSDIENQNQIEK